MKPSRWTATDISDAESRLVTTFGELFADGSAIELVASKSDGHLNVLFWNQHAKVVASQVKHLGRVYRAPDLHETLLRAIRFPSNAYDYGTARKFLIQTRSLFERYVGLAIAEAALLTAWTCSTWFADGVSTPPTLVVSGPDMGPAITLFRLLSCLCRRPLVLADINRAGLLSLAPLHPTLLINQPNSSPKFWDLLGTSNHRGVYVVGNRGQVCNVVSAKAVLRGRADMWNDQAIQVILPSLSNSPPLDEHREVEIANLFQPRFLMYRLRNFAKVRESRPAVCQFETPDSEIARNLMACIQAEPDIAQAIVPILQRQHQDAQARRGCDVSVAIVEVIWGPLHETKEMTITRITDLTNALLRCRGEVLEYSAIEVGWKLKHLGLDRHRNGSGMVLQFSKENRLLIHELAQRFGLKLRPTIGCADCSDRGVPTK